MNNINNNLIFPKELDNRFKFKPNVEFIEKEKYKRRIRFDNPPIMFPIVSFMEILFISFMLIPLYKLIYLGSKKALESHDLFFKRNVIHTISTFIVNNDTLISGIFFFLIMSFLIVSMFFTLSGKPTITKKEKRIVLRPQIRLIQRSQTKVAIKKYSNIEKSWLNFKHNKKIQNNYKDFLNRDTNDFNIQSIILKEEYELDKHYGVNNPTQKGVDTILNDFFNFYLSFKTVKTIMNHVLEEKNIAKRYSFWLGLSEFVANNHIVEKINKLENESKLLAKKQELVVKQYQLLEEIEESIIDWLKVNDEENVKNNHRLYYKELVNK